MLLLKPRIESPEITKFRYLNNRLELTEKDKKRLYYLEKGYAGEVLFDQITAQLQNGVYILNDLCLEFNNSVFQIDTTIIAQDRIFPIEVKNYEGDFFYDLKEKEFYTLAKDEIKNPLDQLKRTKTLFNPFLKKFGFNIPLDGYVTFVNPEFTLYQAPLNEPIVLPTQLKKFINKLNQLPSKLNDHHKQLAELLISMHQNNPRYKMLPSYDYHKTKKGITCCLCHSFVISVNDKYIICNCGCQEDIESAILRTVKELRLLFPDLKITTNIVYEWCKVINSKKVIRRVLKKYFEAIGERHFRYYR
ncbi:nuclease-related domain-containing protein [Neobacillus mesonae]|uniref:nuclease-related domain-containing protein n=1 Tax=Neobacillus mesonae TaxID=1193713 RepID=UPI00203CB3E0|nr:nuclease-related domain-containing protein [Neobacillus mesonae]MCM3566472.1 NERD domain-containing protein [Neobacillus mesonae]